MNLCLIVCVREREREGGREGGRERERWRDGESELHLLTPAQHEIPMAASCTFGAVNALMTVTERATALERA